MPPQNQPAPRRIIGIMLVKDEDVFVERALLAVMDFCDRIIVADNMSTDRTGAILERLAAAHDKIELHRVENSKRTHALISPYAGQDVFVFGVDGDELYDPAGLGRLRTRIVAGEFDRNWCLYGQVLHCTGLDEEAGTARGFATPPARSMTKLYNFAILESWEEPVQQRLHGHNMRFREGFSTADSLRLYQREGWDACDLRCLHMCFVPRSSIHEESLPRQARKNISELHTRRDLGGGWKETHYAQGEEVTRDARPFLGGAGEPTSLPVSAESASEEGRNSEPRIFEMALVAIIKNEAPYIEEWIAYHRLIGFDHVFLFDNGSTDGIAEVLAPYITRGVVTLISWPMRPGQVDAYDYARRFFGPSVRWMACIDPDEFIRLAPGTDLKDFLGSSGADQLLMRWRMFGHSGHREPPAGLTTESFTRCQDGLSHINKTLVRPDAIAEMSVHFARLKPGRRTVDGTGRAARAAWDNRAEPTDEVVWLNHYYTRSFAEYTRKMARGDVATNRHKDMGDYHRWDFEPEDRVIAERAEEIRREIEGFRGVPISPGRYGSSSTEGNAGTAYPFSQEAKITLRGLPAQAKEIAPGLVAKRGGRGGLLVLPGSDATMSEELEALWRETANAFAERVGGEPLFGGKAPVSAAVPFRAELDPPTSQRTGFVFAAFALRATGPCVLRWHVSDGDVRAGSTTGIPEAGLILGLTLLHDAPIRPRELELRTPKRGGRVEHVLLLPYFIS